MCHLGFIQDLTLRCTLQNETLKTAWSESMKGCHLKPTSCSEKKSYHKPWVLLSGVIFQLLSGQRGWFDMPLGQRTSVHLGNIHFQDHRVCSKIVTRKMINGKPWIQLSLRYAHRIIDLSTKDMCYFPILLVLLNDNLSTKAGECILSPVFLIRRFKWIIIR